MARPNTAIHYPLFTSHKLKMPAGTLKAAGWEHLARNFPDSEVVVALLGICQYGARIGYESVRSAVTIHSNLSTANDDPALVTAEIISEIERGRLEVYPNRASLPNNYTASPIGLTDKSDGSKRRIHHLSYPAGDSSSVNDGIPPEYGVIKYSNIDDAILAIQTLGRDCILVKRDFESAFRHIPVSPLDTPLIGFHWAGEYYAERFLPFGLRTAPYIFNLFAEVFHWILEDKLHHANPNITIIHYLDDFLMVLPRTGNLESCTETFERLCFEVGLSIKECKNEQGTLACFGGIELDTAKMVIRLPEKKLHKARKIIKQAVAWKSVSLLDLQKITGYFNSSQQSYLWAAHFSAVYTTWKPISLPAVLIANDDCHEKPKKTSSGGPRSYDIRRNAQLPLRRGK